MAALRRLDLLELEELADMSVVVMAGLSVHRQLAHAPRLALRTWRWVDLGQFRNQWSAARVLGRNGGCRLDLKILRGGRSWWSLLSSASGDLCNHPD
jgi:hypothetical protein